VNEFGEFAPCNEPGRELFAIKCSAQHMPLEREMLADLLEAREKFLCALRVAKATHAPLTFACRSVAVLCAVVEPSGRFDEHVLHVRKLRDLSFCSRIAGH